MTQSSMTRTTDLSRPEPDLLTEEETVRLERALFAQRMLRGRKRQRWGRVRRWLTGLLVLALAGGLAYLVGWSPVLASDRVRVTGTTSLNPVLVESTAAVPMGTPMVRIDLDRVRERLSALPAIRSTRVTREWPGTVHIAIVERTPVAVVPRQGSWRALSPEGVLFRRYDARPKGLPEIKDEQGADRDALREAAKVVGALPADLLRRVDFVSVASVDEITLTLRSGRTVVWGTATRSADKALVLGVMLDRPGRTLDVSVPARPTTR